MKTLDQIRTEAWAITVDCTTRHDVPADAPEDLRDTAGWMDFTADGHLVSSRLLPEDVVQGIDEPQLDYDVTRHVAIATPALALASLLPVVGPVLAGAGVVGLGVHMYRRGGGRHALTAVATAVGSALTLGLALPLATYFQSGARGNGAMATRKRRGRALIDQSATLTGTSRFARQHAVNAEIRSVQVENTKRDGSAFIRLGTASGVFGRNLDPMAPDAGLPFGISAGADVSCHVFGFGMTGTGKTAGLARPVIRQWSDQNCGGLVVLDGKGHLPAEMSNIPDYQLIQPGKTQLALLEGLLAEDVVAVLAANAEKGGDDGGFWLSSGESMLRHAAVMLEAAPDKERFPWTVVSLQKLINDESYRKELITHVGETCAETVNAMGPLFLAAAYWLDEYPKMDAKTSSNVSATVNSWLSPLTGHRDLIAWAAAPTGFDVTSVLNGARIGVNCPSYLYGRAGNVVSALVKARIYRAIRRRDSDWSSDPSQKPVLLAMDECHLLLDRNDSDIVTVGRSLGIRILALTQGIDELISRLGSDPTYAMLNNFRSIVSFSSSKRTIEYVSARAGSHLRSVTSLHDADKKANGVDYSVVERTTVYGPANNAGLRDAFDGESFGLGDLAREGVTQVRSLLESTKERDTMRGSSSTVGRILAPTCTPEEAEAHLARPWHAIAVIQRGGVPRRDVIKVAPIFS